MRRAPRRGGEGDRERVQPRGHGERARAGARARSCGPCPLPTAGWWWAPVVQDACSTRALRQAGLLLLRARTLLTSRFDDAFLPRGAVEDEAARCRDDERGGSGGGGGGGGAAAAAAHAALAPVRCSLLAMTLNNLAVVFAEGNDVRARRRRSLPGALAPPPQASRVCARAGRIGGALPARGAGRGRRLVARWPRQDHLESRRAARACR